MKVRLGYVSNSSSSSYTCYVCGRTESGYDLCLSEIEMKSCECGHEFCDEHMITSFPIKYIVGLLEENQGYNDDIKKLYEKLKELPPDTIFSENTCKDDWDLFYDFFVSENGSYGIPTCFCPICSLNTILDSDMLSYLLKEYNLEKNRVENEMKFRFNNLEELKDYLNKKEE